MLNTFTYDLLDSNFIYLGIYDKNWEINIVQIFYNIFSLKLYKKNTHFLLFSWNECHVYKLWNK